MNIMVDGLTIYAHAAAVQAGAPAAAPVTSQPVNPTATQVAPFPPAQESSDSADDLPF